MLVENFHPRMVARYAMLSKINQREKPAGGYFCILSQPSVLAPQQLAARYFLPPNDA